MVHRRRVLLAEDDFDVRMGIARLLDMYGYEVRAVASGAELLDVLAGWILDGDAALPADCIVTDVRMPGFDGLHIVEGLREHGYQEPIVVISAFGDEVLKKRLKKLPDVRFLAKPFDPGRLTTVLAELMLRPRAVARRFN
jgi:CheY-like chemotaxis protein